MPAVPDVVGWTGREKQRAVGVEGSSEKRGSTCASSFMLLHPSSPHHEFVRRICMAACNRMLSCCWKKWPLLTRWTTSRMRM